METYAILAAAAFLAGIMNAVAGGGTFVTFPTLVYTGVPSVMANASNAVALFPGSFASAWAYRKDFQKFEGVSLRAMSVVSVFGGLAGALLLRYTPETTFDALVPWLLLVATLIFAFGPKIVPFLRRHIQIGRTGLLTIQFLVAVYGGYFGGAMGIIMLAVYSIFGLTNLNAMNAAKALMAGIINGVALLIFVGAGMVVWRETAVMLVFAVAGGYFGARVARGMKPQYLRMGIITISVIVTAAFFLRR